MGELLSENGIDGDGVVILTSLEDAPVQAAYIRAGDTYRMTDISNGDYRLFFSKGEKWDDESKTFTEQVRRQRFEDTFTFASTVTSYSIWNVTLYGVPGGDARSVPVPEEQFPKLR